MTVTVIPMIPITVASDLCVTHTAAGEPEGPDAEVTLGARLSGACPIHAGVDVGGGRERHQELKRRKN